MITTFEMREFSPHLFWDIDKNAFDINLHKSFFIVRVLEYGRFKDWQLILKIFDLDEIKEAVLNASSIDDVSLHFISNFLNINIKEFKCYKNKQLHPNFWNS
jgi:hypothetical protein